MKRAALFTLATVCACTPGGVTLTQGGGGSATSVMTVKVSLSAFGVTQTTAGSALGFSPATVNVPVGTGIRFVNVDNTTHTASQVSGSTFPANSPLTFTATSPSQTSTISTPGWSSGNLQAGQTSQTFLVDKAGLYLYGCFYHYGGMMRGEIVAQ